jgi:ABC-type Fe3+/spermidine/putrescine transport system ATPase subunit
MAEYTGEHHIEVDDLMVHYGDVMAIKGVSFAVRWGEHLTLLGSSGCGKTTTLRAIAGLEQPSAGEIRIGGQVDYFSTSVRTVYLWLSREQPCSTVNTWQVRISHRVFLGDFVQYLVEWAGHQLVVRRPPTEYFDEGEQVYLSIVPEHCVLLEA